MSSSFRSHLDQALAKQPQAHVPIQYPTPAKPGLYEKLRDNHFASQVIQSLHVVRNT